MTDRLAFASKHFIITSLATGIHAAIANFGGHAICNASLVDLGGQILAFDTFISPQAAADLHRFSTEQFGQAPHLVINSHYHNDHIWGNQVFTPGAQIISSDRTRQLIATSGKEEFDWFSSNSAQRLESLRVQYQTADDEKQRNQLLLWIGEYEAVVEAVPHLTICLPNITFDSRLEIHGTQRSAVLFSYGDAHTGSDTILHLPQDGIVFMGDLLFVGCHPYLGDGNPFKLLAALRELSQLEVTCYVPGHGPVGTIDDVKLLIAYIEDCIDTAQSLVKIGDVSEGRIKELAVPEKYQAWQISMFYQSNITFLCQRLASTNDENQAPG